MIGSMMVRTWMAVVIGGLAAAAPAEVVTPAATQPTTQAASYQRAPYLAKGSETSMTIVWRTGAAIDPVVRIGNAPGELTREITGAAIQLRTAGETTDAALAGAPAEAHQYEATIGELSPDTTYYYGVYDGDRLIAGADDGHHFRTHPPAGARNPFRFWVVGDSGTGGPEQAAVHDAMLALVAEQKRPLDFYIHVGDMAYNTGLDDEFQNKFFRPYQVTLRNTVCWPSLGNHEGITASGKTGLGPYFDAYVVPTAGESGGLASGTESYYSFDYGNAHFICLNSHDLDRNPSGAMARWLKADLEATTSDWIIAFWHHPPYTKGSHDSDTEVQHIEMREHIMPILESAGVDLVLTGHSHIYERSMLIDGAYATPTVAKNVVLDDGDGDPNGDGAYRKSAGLNPNEGAVQVVAGHGGTGLRRVGTMPVMKRVFVEHGSVIVDVEGDTLTAIMLNLNGEQRDLFSIVKRGKVTPTRIAKPKQLPRYVRFDDLATLRLEGAVTEGPNTAVVTIAPIPAEMVGAGAKAQITWETGNTAWKAVPPIAIVPLVADQPIRREFAISHTGAQFPLPRARVTYYPHPEKDASGAPATQPADMLQAEIDTPLPLVLLHSRTAALKPMATAPTLDGVLSAEELAGLAPQSGFAAYAGTGAARRPTEFYVGLHENKLYVAVVNHEPEMAKLQVPDRPFDGAVYDDDGNEIFLGRAGTPGFYQFIMNAEGQRFDNKSGDVAWNGDWTTATRREADRWISESLISLDMLGNPLQPGETLLFNVVRNNQVLPEMTVWSFTNGHTKWATNQQPDYFGVLTLEK